MVAQVNIELNSSVEAFERYPHLVPLQTETTSLEMKLKSLILREEADLKQKSKISWLKLGDKNTRFFSSATKERKAKNSTVIEY